MRGRVLFCFFCVFSATPVLEMDFKLLQCVSVLTTLFASSIALDNGVAITPPSM